MLEFDQNILSEYPLKEASLDFKTTGSQRKDMFRSRMRCDHKTKMQHSTTMWLTIQRPSRINYSSNICVSPSNFDHSLFWGCSGDQNDQWQAPSQIPLVFCSPICGLDSCNYSTECPEIPPWYSNLLFGLYHIRNSGCMGFNKVRQKVRNLTDASSPTWVAERCQSWQRHLSSWCYSETWLNHITMVSRLQSHLLIHLFTVLESMADPSIFPILTASSILLAILTTSCQSSNVVAVVWELLETFQ